MAHRSISPFGDDKRPSAFPTLPPEREDILDEGMLLSDTYEVRGLLGSGGLGQVYDAMDHSLGRRVAIKVSWTRDGRLREEARAVAAFRHVGLPAIHCIGRHDGIDYVVQERIYGITLADQLDLAGEAMLPVEEVQQLLTSITGALGAIHEAGLVHLDLRPANIMVTPDARVVLMDFGLCVPKLNLTAQAREAITPSYTAPELISGEIDREAARLADVYDMGVLAFELLTGRVPLQLDSLAAVGRASTTRRPALKAHRTDVPEELGRLVDGMLSIDPRARPQDVDEVRRTLHLSSMPVGWPRQVNVMIVEDSPYVAKTLGRYTQEALSDAEVKIAHDGQTAIDILRDWQPDLMLLDLHMPDMSGIELCMYLRGAGLASRCKIISVSATANPEDRELLHVLGIREFLVKDASLKGHLSRLLRASKPISTEDLKRPA